VRHAAAHAAPRIAATGLGRAAALLFAVILLAAPACGGGGAAKPVATLDAGDAAASRADTGAAADGVILCASDADCPLPPAILAAGSPICGAGQLCEQGRCVFYPKLDCGA
jgi:hypothetical protein